MDILKGDYLVENIDNSIKPIVAHLHSHFFTKSETFIYNYISNHKNFIPICLADKIMNLDVFSFSMENIHKTSFHKYSVFWALDKFSNIFKKNRLLANSIARKIIKIRKAVIMHAHFGPNGWASLPIKRKLNLPLVTTFYGYDISRLARDEVWLGRYKKLFKEGELFLVEGKHMRECLMRLGCPEDKVRIQRIAIDVSKIPFEEREKENGKTIIVFAGRFEEKKGLIYALKAVKEVKDKNYDIEFRIIGDGSLRKEIEKYICNNNMQNYTYLLGFLNYKQYLQEMQKGHIFIHPSVTARDGDTEGGAPTTILEAQAMGMPVISTYHADIPNIVKPQKSALLSKEKDQKELASNIEHLLLNQEKWSAMGSVGRKFVEEYHDIGREIYALEDKYLNLIEGRAG